MASRHALNLLVNVGISIRTIKTYAIHHDKYIIVDNVHLETGSFNFTTAAAKRNSENIIVLWNHPELVKPYLQHWNNRWQQGSPYQSTY